MIPVYVFAMSSDGGGGAPTILSVSPAYAETDGEFDDVPVSVTITSTGGFTGATGAAIDGTSLTSFSVVDDTHVTGVVPAKVKGTYDLTVDAPGGTGTLTNGFTYVIDPADTTGIVFWLDAEIDVTEAAGAISNWGNRVAGASDAAQASAPLKPAHTANAFGTRHGVTWTPDQVLQLAAKYTHTTGFTWIGVIQYTSTDTTSAYGGDAPLSLYGDGTGGVYNGLGMNAGAVSAMQYSGGWIATLSAITALNDGLPHHVAVTHSAAGVLKIYIDGALDTTASVPYNITFNGFDRIGAGYGSQDGFDGDTGEFIACDGVLAAGEILDHYNRSHLVWGVA